VKVFSLRNLVCLCFSVVLSLHAPFSRADTDYPKLTYEQLQAIHQALTSANPASDLFINLFNSFQQLTNLVIEDKNLRFDVEHMLDAEVLTSRSTGRIHPSPNDVTFSTLVGKPFAPGSAAANKAAALNYVRNAAGLTLTHEYFPSAGNSQEAREYNKQVNLVASIQSFGAYVLSYLYVDHGHRSQIDQELAMQASSAQWQKLVAIEPPTDVQRQMLMFESQIYLQQARLIELQRDSLAAQVMTNTLLLQNPALLENVMRDRMRSAPGN
jgi:hypothetical protein